MARQSGRYLNHVMTALAHRKALLELGFRVDGGSEVSDELYPFGEDVKMITRRTHNPTWLTPEEKDDVVAKYESGMNMKSIANLYNCHRTTVSNLLRKRGVEIRN